MKFLSKKADRRIYRKHRGLKPCHKNVRNRTSRFEALHKNSRSDRPGVKKKPPGPGVGRRTGRGLKVWGPLRPKYPPVSANGPQGKILRLEVGGPEYPRETASRVPWNVGAFQSPSPLLEARGHPRDTLGSWGYKRQRQHTNPGPERGKEGRCGISHDHHHPAPMAPRHLHLTTIHYCISKEKNRKEGGVMWPHCHDHCHPRSLSCSLSFVIIVMIIVISYSINDVTWHLSEAFGYFHKPVPPYIWEHQQDVGGATYFPVSQFS